MYIDNADENGNLEVTGKVESGLPYGELHITLPDSDYEKDGKPIDIMNTIQLQIENGDPVYVGELITITGKITGKPYTGATLPNEEGVYVTLTTAIEDADIYYTLDGPDPSKENGTEYTVVFLVKAETTEAVTRTVKAIAIKGDEKSNVATLEIKFAAELPKYIVTFGVVGENGELTAAVGPHAVISGAAVDEGSDVVFTATPDSGYQVKEWKVDENVVGDKSNTYTLENLATAVNVTVEFEEESNPTLVEIDTENAVEDVEVVFGTLKDNAKEALVQKIKIKDSNDQEHEVDLTWSIDSYDPHNTGDYNATGTFELPAGVDQTEPETELKVTAIVKVISSQYDSMEVPAGSFDIEVDYGTDEETAIGLLADKVYLVGTKGERYEVSINWTIASYDGHTAGEYTATGELTPIPAGWQGVPANVTARVTVKEGIKVFFLLSDASPGAIEVFLDEFTDVEHEHTKIQDVVIEDFELVKKGDGGADQTIDNIKLAHGDEGDDDDRDYTISLQEGTFDDGIYTLEFSRIGYKKTYACVDIIKNITEFEISEAKSQAKADIKPSWTVQPVEVIENTAGLPNGVEVGDYKITIQTKYEDLATAQASGRTVTTKFQIPAGVKVWYPYVDPETPETLEWKLATGIDPGPEGEPTWYEMGMPGHPLSADNIEADGVAYVALDASVTGTAFEFDIELRDADPEWENVVYGEQRLDVDITSVAPIDKANIDDTINAGLSDIQGKIKDYANLVSYGNGNEKFLDNDTATVEIIDGLTIVSTVYVDVIDKLQTALDNGANYAKTITIPGDGDDNDLVLVVDGAIETQAIKDFVKDSGLIGPDGDPIKGSDSISCLPGQALTATVTAVDDQEFDYTIKFVWDTNTLKENIDDTINAGLSDIQGKISGYANLVSYGNEKFLDNDTATVKIIDGLTIVSTVYVDIIEELQRALNNGALYAKTITIPGDGGDNDLVLQVNGAIEAQAIKDFVQDSGLIGPDGDPIKGSDPISCLPGQELTATVTAVDDQEFDYTIKFVWDTNTLKENIDDTINAGLSDIQGKISGYANLVSYGNEKFLDNDIATVEIIDGLTIVSTVYVDIIEKLQTALNNGALYAKTITIPSDGGDNDLVLAVDGAIEAQAIKDFVQDSGLIGPDGDPIKGSDPISCLPGQELTATVTAVDDQTFEYTIKFEKADNYHD